MPKSKNEVSEDIELFNVDASELDSVLEGLPSEDSKIILYRVTPQGRPAYLAEFSPSDFSLDAIKNTFGGGKFKYVAKASGYQTRNGMFEIEGESKFGIRPVIKKYNDEGKLVFAKRDGHEGFDTNLAPVTPTDPYMFLLAEIKSLKDEIRGGSNKGSNDIRKEILSDLVMLKELIQPPVTNPLTDTTKMVSEILEKGMQIANLGEGGGSPWLVIFEKLSPLIQQVASAVLANGANRATMPSSMPPNLIPPSTGTVLTGFPAFAGLIRPYLPILINSASNDTDPSVYVEIVVPQIPEAVKPKVLEWLNSALWFQDLRSLDQRIEAQAFWWNELRAGLLTALTAPVQSETATEDDSLEPQP